MSDVISRLMIGAKYGFIFACLYGIYAVGLYTVRGPAPFAHDGTTLGATLAAYFAGGIVAGGVVGALQPLTRIRTGAILVYSIAAFLVFVSIAIAADGIHNISWFGCALGGVLFGTIGAFAWRKLL